MTYSTETPIGATDAEGQFDDFLGALTALGGSAGNGNLREVLEWDEESYEACRDELINRGLIVPGRGPPLPRKLTPFYLNPLGA